MNRIDNSRLSPQSATHRAYLQLRQDIISGDLQPGERLKVDTIKLRLQTGASPVREALSLLTSDQLVERFDQRGFRVASASRKQFEEILRLRCLLEERALRDSINSGDQVWEEALVLSHHHLSRSHRDDAVVFEERHRDFHMSLLAACGSEILMKFCGQLYDLNVRYRYLALKSAIQAKRDIDAEHQAILNAAIDRNADLAVTHLLDHYRTTGAFLSQQLD